MGSNIINIWNNLENSTKENNSFYQLTKVYVDLTIYRHSLVYNIKNINWLAKYKIAYK